MSDDIEKACRECWLGIANQTDEHAISTLTALVRERIPSQLLDVLAFKDARIAALEAALEKADAMLEEVAGNGDSPRAWKAWTDARDAYQDARAKVKP